MTKKALSRAGFEPTLQVKGHEREIKPANFYSIRYFWFPSSPFSYVWRRFGPSIHAIPTHPNYFTFALPPWLERLPRVSLLI